MTDIDPLIRGFFHAQDALTAAASNNAGTIIWQIVLQIVLIALNAVFACAEIAVLSVSDAKLAILVESGNKRAKRLAKLTKQPARFLATIQVAITLAGFPCKCICSGKLCSIHQAAYSEHTGITLHHRYHDPAFVRHPCFR